MELVGKEKETWQVVNISVNVVVCLFPECYLLARRKKKKKGNSINTKQAARLYPLSAGECCASVSLFLFVVLP